MGAIIAAGIALDWDDDELEWRIRKAFVESNPLDDWTLPVISLTRGAKVDRRLKEHFGDVEIAELVRPYFCLSSNLASGRAHVHRSGRLRDALRASIAIPGLLPPVVVHGQILVDGAVFTNFPAREMRAFHRGAVVGIDVTRSQGLNPDDFIDPPSFFGWVRRHGFKAPPPIASLLMRAATVGVADHHDRGREAADLLILPDTPVDIRQWDRFDDVVAAGYEAAQDMLAGITDEMRGRLGLPPRTG